MTTNRFLSGSCVHCGQGTDTALTVHGEAEWHIAFLVALGFPMDLAEETFRAALSSLPGQVPDGWLMGSYRVCAECAGRAPAPFPTPVLLTTGANLPVLRQPEA